MLALGIVLVVAALLLGVLAYSRPWVRIGRTPRSVRWIVGNVAALLLILSLGAFAKATVSNSSYEIPTSFDFGTVNGLSVGVNATSSDSKGTVDHYNWSWQDVNDSSNNGSKTVSTADTTLELQKSGSYLVSLNVEDQNHNDGAYSNSIKVTPATPRNPDVGNDNGTANSVGAPVKSWVDVYNYGNAHASYKACVVNRLNVTWNQVQQWSVDVQEGHDLRAVLISNSTITPAAGKAALVRKGFNVNNLPVFYLHGFENTEGLPTNACDPFGDGSSQVRLVITIPSISEDALSKLPLGPAPLGDIHTDKFVLGPCGNPGTTVATMPR